GIWARSGHRMELMRRGPIPPLRELTLGIVGLGRIGSAVARRAQSFGMTVVACDPYAEPDAFSEQSVEQLALLELCCRADVISLPCWLTDETQGMIGREAFARMKRSAVLVNTARGPIVDLGAAIDALRGGQIAGAALDVVYPEPLPDDSPLFTLPNVILT